MTSAFSWQNTISLCPASFCTPTQKLPVTPGISWLPTFAFQSPIWKGHLFWVLVLDVFVGLHRTVQLQLLQHYWLGYRLGLLWYWMVCLGNEQRSFCHFWDWIQVLHFRLFCWLLWLLHFFSVILGHRSRYSHYWEIKTNWYLRKVLSYIERNGNGFFPTNEKIYFTILL